MSTKRRPVAVMVRRASIQALGVLSLSSVLLLSGCISLDSLNPFSSSTPKVKVKPLPAFEAKAAVNAMWQAKIGESGNYSLTPALVDGSVFVAATDGSVARFDQGKQVWRTATGQVISGGVGSDGRLVAVGTAKGEVLALDAASGKILWTTRVSSEVLAPPAIADGLVVVRSGDARIVGLEAADGKRRWMYQRNVPALALRSYASVLNVGKTIYAGFAGGKLVALASNNGSTAWEATVASPKGTTELERITDVISSPVLAGNAVCAVAYQGRVACFDVNTGNQQWSREMSSTVGLAADERQIYVTDTLGRIQALSRDSGSSMWLTDKLMTRSPTRPVLVDDFVVVADVEGFVHALRKDTGALVGRMNTDGSAVRGDPASNATGLVVQTVNGGVYGMAVK
nr:outer membrane beta-barrel assembly protein BamB [uncultured bacterium]